MFQKVVVIAPLVVAANLAFLNSSEGATAVNLSSLRADALNPFQLAQVTGPSVGFGGETSNEGGTGGTSNPGGGGATENASAASLEITTQIALQISEASSICDGIPDTYLVDCLARELQDAAQSVPSNREYREAKRTLNHAARDLKRLVRNNVDVTQPRVVIRHPDSPTLAQTRPLSPVKPEAVEAVKARAFKIVAEAETRLLRSADNSRTRSAHYLKLAEAVGSNKLLLRS